MVHCVTLNKLQKNLLYSHLFDSLIHYVANIIFQQMQLQSQEVPQGCAVSHIELHLFENKRCYNAKSEILDTASCKTRVLLHSESSGVSIYVPALPLLAAPSGALVWPGSVADSQPAAMSTGSSHKGLNQNTHPTCEPLCQASVCPT